MRIDGNPACVFFSFSYDSISANTFQIPNAPVDVRRSGGCGGGSNNRRSGGGVCLHRWDGATDEIARYHGRNMCRGTITRMPATPTTIREGRREVRGVHKPIRVRTCHYSRIW